MFGEVAVQFGPDGGDGFVGQEFDGVIGGGDAEAFARGESGKERSGGGGEEGSAVGCHRLADCHPIKHASNPTAP